MKSIEQSVNEEETNNNNNDLDGTQTKLRRVSSTEEQKDFLSVFPSYQEKSQNNNKRANSVMKSKLILDDPTSTLRSTTKAQARLGYTQTSAMLTWQNISCDSDKDIKLFPVSGYIKPGQMLCVLGGGDNSGIPELFRILRNPSRIYNTLHGTYTAHGDILLNGLPPGKFYTRFVLRSFLFLISIFARK